MSAQTRQYRKPDNSYWLETLKPLHCLLFVLPLLVFFHLGTQQTGLLAEHWLKKILSPFGGTAVCLPPLAIVSVLLGQHLFKRDRWEIHPRVLGGMCVESVLWIIPLIAVSHITALIFLAATTQPSSLDSIRVGIGAGIYEEFIFHLLAIGLIMAIFIDGMSAPKVPTAILAVVATAILFSLSHLNVPPFYASEPFSTHAFVSRIAAGSYLGAIFILRGFGVAVGAHVMWNIYVYVM